MFDYGERHEGGEQCMAHHRMILSRLQRADDQDDKETTGKSQQDRKHRCRAIGPEIGFQMHDTARHQIADSVGRA